MRKMLAAALVIIAITGCSDKPGMDIGEKHIENYYSNNHFALQTPKNITRINGQPNGEHQYIVKFSYDLVATKSFEAHAKALLANHTQYGEKLADMYRNNRAFNDDTGLLMAVGTVLGPEPENIRYFMSTQSAADTMFKAGTDVKTGQVPAFITSYINQQTPNTSLTGRRYTAVLTLYELYKAAYTPSTKEGDLLFTNTTWSLTHTKTENGWEIQ